MIWSQSGGMYRTKSRRLIGALLLGLFLSVLGLATSAKLHQAVHPNANSPDHHCAAVMLASGKVDTALSSVPMPVATVVPVFAVRIEVFFPSVTSVCLPHSRGPPAFLS
jgi:hypothetical protein